MIFSVMHVCMWKSMVWFMRQYIQGILPVSLVGPWEWYHFQLVASVEQRYWTLLLSQCSLNCNEWKLPEYCCEIHGLSPLVLLVKSITAHWIPSWENVSVRPSTASMVLTASVAVAEEGRVNRTSFSEHSGRSSENCMCICGKNVFDLKNV